MKLKVYGWDTGLRFSAAHFIPSHDEKRIIPSAAYLTGKHAEYYGASGIFIGLPIKIGSNGVEEIYDIDFKPDELELWKKTVASVKSGCAKVDEFLKNAK